MAVFIARLTIEELFQDGCVLDTCFEHCDSGESNG